MLLKLLVGVFFEFGHLVCHFFRKLSNNIGQLVDFHAHIFDFIMHNLVLGTLWAIGTQVIAEIIL